MVEMVTKLTGNLLHCDKSNECLAILYQQFDQLSARKGLECTRRCLFILCFLYEFFAMRITLIKKKTKFSSYSYHHILGGRQVYMNFHPTPLNFLINEENFIFFFISVY
jgi:hypothetical protein